MIKVTFERKVGFQLADLVQTVQRTGTYNIEISLRPFITTHMLCVSGSSVKDLTFKYWIIM